VFVIFCLPLIKENVASSLYANGKYEDALNMLNGTQNRAKSAELINNCEIEIAKRSAEYILKNDTDLKNTGLQLSDISESRCSLDYKNKTETSSFTVDFKNDNYTFRGSYNAVNSKTSDGQWTVMSYSLINSQIIPELKSDRNIVDAVVLKDYPKAVFKSSNEISESEIEYLYSVVSPENPLYNTNYNITAKCTYDRNSNSWKVGNISEDYVEATAIKKKEFVTSIFTIELPETWIITRNEEIYTWTNNDGEHTHYNYNYSFYTDSEKNNSTLNIYVYFSAENNDQYSSAYHNNQRNVRQLCWKVSLIVKLGI